MTLDLTGRRTDVESFELIDLMGSGDNSLTLDQLSLLDVSDGTSGGITTFTVRGDAGDSVDLSTNGGGFTADGQRDIDGISFDVYANGNAEVLIEDHVTVQV